MAAASHVHRGQLLLDAGKLQEALTEFQKALAIDSSSFIAQQEIRRTQKLIDAVNAPPRPPPTFRPAKTRGRGAGPGRSGRHLERSHYPNLLKIPRYLRDRRQAGGNQRAVRPGLHFAPHQDRIKRGHAAGGPGDRRARIQNILAPGDAQHHFVASDNPAKRKEVEQSVIKTFYLANLSQPTELQDVVNALRQIWKSHASSRCLRRERWWCAELPIKSPWPRN